MPRKNDVQNLADIWFGMAMLGFEAQQVMVLRGIRLMHGGKRAKTEATRMVTEKAVAATQASQQIALGKSSGHVVSALRRKVRANRKRLSKIA